MCLSKNILFQHVDIFFALLGAASALKKFYISLHSTKNLKFKPPGLFKLGK